MSNLRVTGGYLRVEEIGVDGPTDPGFGVTPPIDPGFGGGAGAGLPPIGSTLPEGPPGVWPPLNWLHPVQPLPPESEVPPGAIWPPVGGPPHPWDPIPPDASTKPPTSPPAGGAPPAKPITGRPGKFWVVAGIPGVGWRYVCVDLTAKPPIDEAAPK